MKFDAALAALDPAAFVARVLMERYAVSGAVIGYDFHFGKARAGTPAYLKEEGERLGFAVDVVPELTDDGRRVSSGRGPRGAWRRAMWRRPPTSSVIPGS